MGCISFHVGILIAYIYVTMNVTTTKQGGNTMKTIAKTATSAQVGEEKAEIRFCDDIEMLAIDRGRKSCVHATEFCKKACFNNKLYRIYPAMTGKDLRNDSYWQALTGDKLAETLKKSRKNTARFRLMTRGEAFSTMADIDKVADLLRKSPNTLFWIPTRAWRNAEMRQAIDSIREMPNSRILASIDPSNSPNEINEIVAAGWSTMFFGNNNECPTNAIKCPKTWEKIVHCMTCSTGCFKASQVHVWLKSH